MRTPEPSKPRKNNNATKGVDSKPQDRREFIGRAGFIAGGLVVGGSLPLRNLEAAEPDADVPIVEQLKLDEETISKLPPNVRRVTPRDMEVLTSGTMTFEAKRAYIQKRKVVQDFTFRDSCTLSETVAKATGKDLRSRILNVEWYFVGAQVTNGGGFGGCGCCSSGDPRGGGV